MKADYASLNRQLSGLLAEETDVLANTANFVGLLYSEIPRINWLGVYVLRGEQLVLGPFQGKPACVRIALGQGVCGTAADTLQTQRVDDVHTFEGHIVCDPDSKSELVVPMSIDGRLIGVLDIDSPAARRFTQDDQDGVESLCETYLRSVSEEIRRSGKFI
ncbi:MAG: GAF domain-containing protein [Woeseiaceae bacterium]|nr:GAF domain-containing protein [Woeseiaceae bacterium]